MGAGVGRNGHRAFEPLLRREKYRKIEFKIGPIDSSDSLNRECENIACRVLVPTCVQTSGRYAPRFHASPLAVGDPPLGQVVRREFNLDFVAGHNPDEKFSHPTSNVGDDLMPSFDLNAKTGIG